MSLSRFVPVAFLVLVSFIFAPALCHKCIHDEITKDSFVSPVNYGGQHPFELAAVGKRAPVDSWKKIRINFVTDKVSTTKLQTILTSIKSKLENIFYVFPVSGNLQLSRVCLQFWTQKGEKYQPNRCTSFATPSCGDYGKIPSSYFKSESIYSQSSPNFIDSETEGGAGVANTDFLIFVTEANSENCVGGNTLAYASSCFRNQFDAPTGGYINVCPSGLSKTDGELESIMIHEIFHALGFSSSDFARFRDANGQTYSNPLVTFTERGTTVTKLALEPSLQTVRNHFGCPSLQGVELENQGGSGTAGSHVERKVYNNELMCGEIQKNAVISEVSLAIMEASNWYRVDYSFAQRLSWGKGKGCNFAYQQKCLTGSGPTNDFPRHFCTTSDEVRCSTDLKFIGSCDLSTHSSAVPTAFQYFSNANKGGTASLDYCPHYAPDVSCATGSSSSTRSETYGSGSKCLHNTLSTSITANSYSAGCYKVTCQYNNATSTAASSVMVEFSPNVNVTCAQGEEGNQKTVQGLSGYFECPPNYDDACETKPSASFSVNQKGCKFLCRNGGTCSDEGVCQCVSGYKGDICEMSNDARVHSLSWTIAVLVVLICAATSG